MCKRFGVFLNIMIVFYIRITSADSQFDVLKTSGSDSFENQSKGIMSPKMDYDEWTPIGRGDPLKNDPTFDYSPPMVGKVKYWINPLLRTPDPPIVPTKDLTTETSQITTTITSSTKSNLKYSTDIKRFHIDFKERTDMSYVQPTNSKYNNKLVRPHVQYQNHYYTPTHQPPPPLPMLVPLSPMEPNIHSSEAENMTTIDTLKSQTSLPPATTAPSNTQTITKFSTTTPKMEGKPEPTKSDPSFLKLLSDKETSENYQLITKPTTVKPSTPYPTLFLNKYSQKSTSYLIIQGHSKVKKYGAGKIERSDNILIQDTNHIREPMKYDLPKEIREDLMTDQAEGFGIGAELARVVFSSYIKPTPTMKNESHKICEKDIDQS